MFNIILLFHMERLYNLFNMSKIDRDKVMKEMLDVWNAVDAKAVKRVPVEAWMVQGRVSDFDPVAEREIWHNVANHSSIRDVYCKFCGAQVVMSNKAWSDYELNGKKNVIICTP